MQDAPAVFVHGMWRAATTYFWNKLRAQQGLCCFYEPLHERMSILTPTLAQRPQMAANASVLRHPEMSQGYFAEYETVLRGGSSGFAPRLSYDAYLLNPEDEDEALRRYLERLIGAARRAARRPVLCFVRSAMRAAWMRQRFGGVHIAQIRNPRDQWESFGPRSYFTSGVTYICSALAQRDPRVLSHLVDSDGAEGRTVLPDFRVAPTGKFTRTGPSVSLENKYAMLVLLWLASTLQTLSMADIVLDCDRLSMDAAARDRVAARLAEAGLAVELDDLRIPRHPARVLNADALKRIEQRTIRHLADGARSLVMVDSARLASALEFVDSFSRGLLEAAMRALQETPAKAADSAPH